MKQLKIPLLILFVNVLYINMAASTRLEIPSLEEATIIINDLANKRPLVNFRKEKYKSTRKLEVKSIFYNKSILWDYTNDPEKENSYYLSDIF